jgi:hypothetical protein
MGDHSHISMELDEVSLCYSYIVTRCIINLFMVISSVLFIIATR